jgi:hypothetical protein
MEPLFLQLGALKGQIDVAKERVFGIPPWWLTGCKGQGLALAKQAVELFDYLCIAARKSIDTWSLIGKRLGVVKDIRLLIAKMIWEARSEGTYKVLL